MVYTRLYYGSRPRELLLDLWVANPAPGAGRLGSVARAILDTGATDSAIQADFARMLLLPPNSRRGGTIWIPSVTGPPATAGADQVLVRISVQRSDPDIREVVEATLLDTVDLNPRVKLILGMDFIGRFDVTFMRGQSGAALGLFRTP